MCCVNDRLLWNNFNRDNSTILSMVFMWEKNSGKPNNAIRSKLAAKSGEILEDSLEWVGLFDKFSNELSARLPIFPSSDLYTIEK